MIHIEPNIRVFYSNFSLRKKYGASWFENIESALSHSKHMILLCSNNSIESKWVKAEYRAFYNNYYKQGKCLLIPVLTGKFKKESLPIFLQEIQVINIGDLSHLSKILEIDIGNNKSKFFYYFNKYSFKVFVVISVFMVLYYSVGYYNEYLYKKEIIKINKEHFILRDENTRVMTKKIVMLKILKRY